MSNLILGFAQLLMGIFWVVLGMFSLVDWHIQTHDLNIKAINGSSLFINGEQIYPPKRGTVVFPEAFSPTQYTTPEDALKKMDILK